MNNQANNNNNLVSKLVKNKKKAVKKNKQNVKQNNNAGQSTSYNNGRLLPRTQASIIKSLAGMNMSQNNMRMHPYTMCRLNPFNGTGKASIPDGGNNKFIVSDSVSVDTITVSASTTFVIQTLPTFPYLAMVGGNSASITVNGTTLGAQTNSTPDASVTFGRTWMPMACMPLYTSKVGTSLTGPATATDVNAVSARIVSVGYRVIYTGPTQTCAGSITVSAGGVSFEECPGPTLAAATVTANNSVLLLASAGNAAVSGYFAGINAPTLRMDVSPNFSTINRTSKTFRPEEGILVVPRHKTNDFKIRDMIGSAPVIIGNRTITQTAAGSTFTSLWPQNVVGFGAGTIPSINFIDLDWESYQICFTNVNSDASFRIETIVCYEVTPAMSSDYMQFTKDASPPQMQIIQQANAAVSTFPAVTSLTSGRLPR